MERTLKLKISAPSKSTQIHFSVHRALERDLPALLEKTPLRPVLITDYALKETYASLLEHLNLQIFSVEPGEANKTRQTKERLEDLLLTHQFGRDSCIIALGGGVICDVAGFLAATYLRGVPLILIPTSLMAMVDAAVGGKTAVNTPYGKNMIGAFNPAEHVFIDGAFLKTLPLDELKNGLAEVIKYGLIHSKKLFNELEEHPSHFFFLDLPFMMKVIEESVSIKRSVVKADPFEEKGLRRILNFGHTIGHALESLENYTLPHGQAISIGMIVESYISCERGLLPLKDFHRILSIFQKYKIPLKLSRAYQIDEVLSLISRDKKAAKSTPRFVLLQKIGEPAPFNGKYCSEVPFELIEKAISWMNSRFT